MLRKFFMPLRTSALPCCGYLGNLPFEFPEENICLRCHAAVIWEIFHLRFLRENVCQVTGGLPGYSEARHLGFSPGTPVSSPPSQANRLSQ